MLLSDIDGLYDGDPRKATADNPARFIPEVAGPGRPRQGDRRAGQPTGHRRHGLEAVLGAAGRRRRDPGAAGRRTDAAEALSDASVGTVFAARPARMSARRFWVRYAAESAGR